MRLMATIRCTTFARPPPARLLQGLRDSKPPKFLVSPATASGMGTGSIAWKLEDEAARRKRLAVLANAPLAEEVTRLLAEAPDALYTEQLLVPTFDWPENWTPGWEAFGRKRVNEGRFATPITYREHVLPIAKALLSGDACRF
jgi:hypothetical protein